PRSSTPWACSTSTAPSSRSARRSRRSPANGRPGTGRIPHRSRPPRWSRCRSTDSTPTAATVPSSRPAARSSPAGSRTPSPVPCAPWRPARATPRSCTPSTTAPAPSSAAEAPDRTSSPLRGVPMHDNRPTSEDRVRRFLREQLPARRHLATAPLTIEAWEVPDEPVPFEEARRQTYTPVSVGDRWGRPWSTLWLHVTGQVPASWTTGADRDIELQLDLSFTTMPGVQAEALIWTPEGQAVKAINPYHQYLTLEAGQEVDLYLECAATPNVPGDWTFAPTALGDKATAGEDPIYDLTTLRLAWRSTSVWELEQDVAALNGLMHTLPEQSVARDHEALDGEIGRAHV